MNEITVIGGGVAGLVASIACAEAGAPVRLSEAHETLGGRGRSTDGPYVANFALTGEGLIARVHREAVGGIPDPQTLQLLEEVLQEPGIPPSWRTPDFASTASPILPVHFRKDDLDVSYFSLVTTVGTPQDVTLQEIRVESFFPT